MAETIDSSWHPPWPGFSAQGTLVLPLPGAAFADVCGQLRCAGLVLQAKREFHVTVLNRRRAAAFLVPPMPDAEPLDLPRLFAALDWHWHRLGETWLLRRRGEDGRLLHSVIERLHMPALNQFREALQYLSRHELPPTPAHVTLFTAGSDRGIGLDSEADFARYRVRPVVVPGLAGPPSGS